MSNTSSIEKINTKTITSQVYDNIKQLIIDGVWKAGDKIPSENILCKEFGVARVSIRSALQYLNAQGYIETKRGDGSYVKHFEVGEHIKNVISMLKITKKEALDLIEYRKLVEPNMMPLVVDMANNDDIAELEKIHSNMLENLQDDNKFAQYDVDFHYYLAKITDNSILYNINIITSDIFMRSMKTNILIMDRKDGLKSHKKIIDAVKNKNKELASKEMFNHIENAKKKILLNFN